MNRRLRKMIRAFRQIDFDRVKRKILENKKKIAVGAGMAVIAISCGVIVYKTTPISRVITKKVVPNASYRSDIDQRPISRAAHVSETAFQGSTLPFDCYNIPFKKTESYVTNIETLKELKNGDEDYNDYLNRAKKFITDQFNTDYRTILSDQKGFKKKVTAIYGEYGSEMGTDSSDKSITSDEIAEQLMQWYVDNKASLRSTFTTDQSMIYRDGINMWMRGVWTVTPDCSQEACDKFNAIYGTNLKSGEKQYYVAEMCNYIQNPTDVIGFTLIKQITGK